VLGPALIALTILGFVWLGYEIAIRSLREGAGVFEIACGSLLAGSALWIASVWIPALLYRLDRPTMLLRTAAVVAAALAALIPRLRRMRNAPAISIEKDVALTWVGPALPILIWVGFVVWRSSIVPPLSHDALAYHLPRAVLWIREHGFGPIPLALDVRMRALPANYEMLLADAMLLAGRDAYVEWVAVFFYVAFVVSCGALAQRWWNDAPRAALPVVLLASAVPVLLLHTGADKNDTMTAFFMVASLVFAGAWITVRDRASLLLCGIATICALGTKPQGLMLAACLFAPVLWCLAGELRSGRMTKRVAAGVAGFSLVATMLLGGAFYAEKAFGSEKAASLKSDREGFVAYDDWANIWQGPWVLLTAPFSPWSTDLYVPGSHERWFWRRDELYFSHLGVPFAVCALLLPFAWKRFRRDAPERARERLVTSVAAVATLLLMLPVHDVPMPHGIYVAALPRYVLFIVPVVFGLTIAPAFLEWVPRGSVRSRIVLYVLAGLFLGEALHAAINDSFVPWEFVMAAREHPGTRLIPFDPYRAASVADRLAGEDEKIAFDAGYSAWIQPAFGANLRRPVEFIPPGSGPPVIAGDAKWVVIDRGFSIIWQHEKFRDTSQWRLYLARGKPRAEDVRVLNALLHDPRFRAVLLNRWRNQAVFQRIDRRRP